MKKKRKDPVLKRPIRAMFRFDKKELREVDTRAKRAGLSRVEYGRRKMLDLPIAEGADTIPKQNPAEFGAAV